MGSFTFLVTIYYINIPRRNWTIIVLKETSTLKANGCLIVGNTVLFQISVKSPAIRRYQCQAKHGLAITYIWFWISRVPPSWITWRHMVAQFFHTKHAMLLNNSGNHMTSQNSKWRLMGNLKARIGDNLTQFLPLLNVTFTLSSKIWDLIITSNNSKPTCCTEEWRFL